MPRLPATFLCLGLFMALASHGHAGEVTLQTQMAATVTSGHLEVAAKVANLGTAPAYDVQAVLGLLGRELAGELVHPGDVSGRRKEGSPESLLDFSHVRLQPSGQALTPGEAALWRYALDLPPELSGGFPAMLRITYVDESRHPLSALAGILFTTQSPVPVSLEAEAQDAVMHGRGEMTVTVKNTGKAPLDVAATLETPRDLSCANPKQALALAPDESRTISYDLVQENGLMGSHAVFCVLEYDQDGMHRTVMEGATVSAGPAPPWFRRTRPWWLALDALLLLAFLAVAVRRRMWAWS